MPGLTCRTALGLLASAAMPLPLRARHAELGMELPSSAPESFAGFIGEQSEFWRQSITRANIRVE